MQRRLRVIQFVLLWILTVGYAVSVDAVQNNFTDKHVLWVDSYHKGYAWSDGLEVGIRKVLKDSGVHLHIFRMQTKTNDSVEFGREAGLQARAELERIQPDIVIATDDNAQKYFVVPFLKNTDLPVVFSGVNWDASEYGYPCSNVTGMVEVDQVDALISHMQRDANGPRVGFLSADVETARKISRVINARFLHNTMKSYMVRTFAEFKEHYIRAQDEVDMLIIYNNVGIVDWNDIAAESFITKNTKIPTGALLQFLDRFAVYTLGKYPEERGEYAASAALQILADKRPEDIPVVRNKRVKLTVNLKVAKSAQITFPLSVLKTAEVIGRDAYAYTTTSDTEGDKSYQGKKVVWVDSYHKGYEWSDGIENGIREIFIDKGIELKIIRMDTKRNNDPIFGKTAGAEAFKQITAYQPDAVIASDDNAQKYLVVPYLLQGGIPVVFCGVNWDASMYGYPTAGVTGMVEVEPVEELVGMMRPYANGVKIGYLCGDVGTERKIVAIYNQKIFQNELIPYYADSMEGFRRGFLKAMEEVDMLILPNHAGIRDWNSDEAEKFIQENIRIPTGGVFDFMSRHVIFTLAKYPEEQGNYAARTVVEILDGKKPDDFPIAMNHRKRVTVNVKMADAAGIVIPVPVLKMADSVIGQESILLGQ